MTDWGQILGAPRDRVRGLLGAPAASMPGFDRFVAAAVYYLADLAVEIEVPADAELGALPPGAVVSRKAGALRIASAAFHAELTRRARETWPAAFAARLHELGVDLGMELTARGPDLAILECRLRPGADVDAALELLHEALDGAPELGFRTVRVHTSDEPPAQPATGEER